MNIRSRNALLNGDTSNYDWDSGYTCHQVPMLYNFFFVNVALAKLARELVPHKHFQSNLCTGSAQC
jgi:hypothetical protein